MKKLFLSLVFSLLALFFSVSSAVATEGQVLGIHILHPSELESAKELISTDVNNDQWHYITIPFSLDDLDKSTEWQIFFKRAKEAKVIPLVRLVSRFENGAWKIPNRKEVVDQLNFLADLEWPTDQKHVIVFNEVNHAPEWGGTIDPQSYAEVFKFASNWARSEQENFVVLPAAMDLAAPNGSKTAEAFSYLEGMYAHDPEIFSYADVWNSHSYPNPGFSSSPNRSAQNSLRGFEHELTFLKERTGKDYKVFITETGWVANNATLPWLESYYTYALQHIWSDPRVIGVTPFVLQGDPGPFSGFTFLDKDKKPTAHYQALKKAISNSGS